MNTPPSIVVVVVVVVVVVGGGVGVVVGVVVVVVVLTLTRIIKSVVTGQAPVTLKLRNTPGKTRTTQGGTRIYIYIIKNENTLQL